MKIEGIFKFFQDGKCIAEQKNNITETGRILAIKTLMGAVPNFGGSLHLGVDGSYNTYTHTPSSIAVSGSSGSYTVVITTSTPHNFSVGNVISISGITASGLTSLNGRVETITAISAVSPYTLTFVSTVTTITGTSFSSGLGTFGALATNTRLGFRVNATSVLSSNIDNSVTYDAILFKAKVDDPMAYKIYEVGLYSDTLSGGAISSKGQLLCGFESGEILLDSGADLPTSGAVTRMITTADSANFRIGSQALQVITTTPAKTFSSFDLSSTTESDLINLAYYANGAGDAKVTFYSGTGTSNKAVYTFTATAAGYYIQSLARSAGVVTGSMGDWSNITKITFEAATSTMIFDGLRIEKPNIVDTINGLISRTALTTPITKNLNTPLDIEYHMRLSFNA